MPGATKNFLDGVERDEIDDGDVAIDGGDVGVEMQAGAEKRGAMLAEEDDGGEDEQDGEDEIGAEVFAMGHGRNEFTEERVKLTGKGEEKKKIYHRGAGVVGAQRDFLAEKRLGMTGPGSVS